MIFSYIIEDMEENPVEDFDYEVEDVTFGLKHLLKDFSKEELINMLVDYAQDELEDEFYSELKEYYEDEAMEYHYDKR